MSVTCDQYPNHRFDGNITTNPVLAQCLEPVQHKLLARNEKTDARFQGNRSDRVCVQKLHHLQKCTIRNARKINAGNARLRRNRSTCGNVSRCGIALSHSPAKHSAHVFRSNGQNRLVCVHMPTFYIKPYVGKNVVIDQPTKIVHQRRRRHRYRFQPELVEIIEDVLAVIPTKDVQTCEGNYRLLENVSQGWSTRDALP